MQFGPQFGKVDGGEPEKPFVRGHASHTADDDAQADRHILRPGLLRIVVDLQDLKMKVLLEIKH